MVKKKIPIKDGPYIKEVGNEGLNYALIQREKERKPVNIHRSILVNVNNTDDCINPTKY